jgi:hypothetical protein
MRRRVASRRRSGCPASTRSTTRPRRRWKAATRSSTGAPSISGNSVGSHARAHARYFTLQLAESYLTGAPLLPDPRAHRAACVASDVTSGQPRGASNQRERECPGGECSRATRSRQMRDQQRTGAARARRVADCEWAASGVRLSYRDSSSWNKAERQRQWHGSKITSSERCGERSR